MRHPLQLIIHAPLREARNFRQTLVGLKNALCVSVDGAICVYDLLPVVKPRKGQEHQLLKQISEQLEQGWTLAVWNVDVFLKDLEDLYKATLVTRPKMGSDIMKFWEVISSADEESFIDLRTFSKFPNGHFLAMIAAKETYVAEDFAPSLRRHFRSEKPKRPVTEDFWGSLHGLIMGESEARVAWGHYQRWVKSNRPRPPQSYINASNEIKSL